MKELSILLSILLSVISIPLFASQHFYQQLCNYTQKPLLITAKEDFHVHPKGLNGAKITPNQCATYRYVVGSFHDAFSGEDSFWEYIYLAPSLTRIVNLHIYNKQWGHKKTRVKQIDPALDFKIILRNRHGRHYTIDVCDSTSTGQCL